MKKEIPDSIRFRLESGLEAIVSPGDDLYEYVKSLRDSNKPLIVPNREFFGGHDLGIKTIWNWKIGVANVSMKLNTFSIPSMPADFGQEYEFPSKVKDVSFEELGNWLLTLGNWKAYAIKLLALADIERIVLSENIDTAISKALAVADKAGKKVTKDCIEGSLIAEQDGFKELKTRLIEKKAEAETYKKVIEIYSTQYDAISREQSRRGLEMKSYGQVI